MKRLLAGCLLSAALVWSAQAALQVGDVAPDFTTQAALAGKTFSFSLKETLKKGPVVVYFYPSAYTHGCNIQAHTFAENHEQFVAAGATVVGVSLDSLARLKEFSADPDFCAGKLVVASDADGRIARAYALKVSAAVSGSKDTRGVEIDHGFAERTTFVVTPDGKVAATIGGVSPAANVEQALLKVRQLGAARLPATKP
ncbi:MAG: peroxiredoxin [Dechloromonas sp.]|nr:peroxiredoxin [Dechloromonas sp.]